MPATQNKPKPSLPKEEAVGRRDEVVQKGWKTAKISDFAKTTSGGTPSRANPEFYTGNIPWIKSGDLNDGNVSEATEFITEEALKSSSAKLFPAGTLMIALYGATIGKLGISSVIVVN
jgi:type I restriction enzyme, S subunit